MNPSEMLLVIRNSYSEASLKDKEYQNISQNHILLLGVIKPTATVYCQSKMYPGKYIFMFKNDIILKFQNFQIVHNQLK